MRGTQNSHGLYRVLRLGLRHEVVAVDEEETQLDALAGSRSPARGRDAA